MASKYSYGPKRRLKRRKGYTLPSGEPRGDSPSGTYNRGRPWGRTGDMQYGYNTTPQGKRERAAAARGRRLRKLPAWHRDAVRYD